MASSSPVTSIVILPLKEGVDTQQLSIPASDLHRSMHNLMDTILAAPGVRTIYWSVEVENPSRLRLLAEWDRGHEHVMSQTIPADKSTQFGQYLSGEPVEYHVTFSSPPDILGNEHTGATELLTVYFPADLSQELKDDFHNRMVKLGEAIKSGAKPGQYTGSVGGWTVEKEVPFHDGSGEGLAYICLIGWESVEAHMDFRGTQAFKDNIGLLLDFPHMATRKMVHVQCRAMRK